MTRPADIPTWAWDEALLAYGHTLKCDPEPEWIPDIERIARALLAAYERGRVEQRPVKAPKKKRSAPRHLDPNCEMGRFMAAEFAKLCPNESYHFMEIMGDGEVVFHLRDEDATRFGMNTMQFVKAAAIRKGGA